MRPRTMLLRAAGFCLAGGSFACAPIVTTTERVPPASAAGAAANLGPLLAEWTGSYGGVPPFDRITIADFKPALETAMDLEIVEVERIAGQPAP
ncbi:MAG TPA: hypothetical protein VMY38_02115, partial [Gemmatimonadaceae bacterium]|nr:hypothetical protein [Gemmatimonadaceae bacterium]